MSDERYTVILGDRRYAIHRNGPPAGRQSFGFLSDLMVDGEGRVHVAQRGTDRPVLVFDRDAILIGSWGEGARGRARTTSTRRRRLDPGGRPRPPIRSCASVSSGQLSRRWASGIGPPWAAVNHPTARQAPDGEIYGRRRLRQFQRSSLCRPTARGSPPGAVRGGGPGTFTTPHAVWVDRFGKVLVGDRRETTASRCSPQGCFLAEWGDFYHPMQIWVDAATWLSSRTRSRASACSMPTAI